MPRIDMTFSRFEEVIRNGYSLDVIFLLKLIDKEKCNIREVCEGKPKMAALYQTMFRKNLITEDCRLTLEGSKILEFLDSEDQEQKLEKKPMGMADDDFEKWWAAYPGTDAFTYKGQHFTGSRGLKRSKDECRVVLNHIVSQGKFTPGQLIEALQLDVNMKMEDSLKSGSNKLSYMQNSLTYLNQKTFEPFVELVKQGTTVKEDKKSIKDVDI